MFDSTSKEKVKQKCVAQYITNRKQTMATNLYRGIRLLNDLLTSKLTKFFGLMHQLVQYDMV